jgi:hypothetical protein
MPLLYQENGNLVPGIHKLTWDEFKKEFGYNKCRRKLLEGLEKAITELKDVQCKTIYVDGSFVTTKSDPNDFDACWDPIGVDFNKFSAKYSVLLEFKPDTRKQKAKYGGEFFPSPRFLTFFQKDKEDNIKGIIKLIL